MASKLSEIVFQRAFHDNPLVQTVLFVCCPINCTRTGIFVWATVLLFSNYTEFIPVAIFTNMD